MSTAGPREDPAYQRWLAEQAAVQPPEPEPAEPEPAAAAPEPPSPEPEPAGGPAPVPEHYRGPVHGLRGVRGFGAGVSN